MEETFIDRLRTEQSQLQCRIIKLKDFLTSESFNHISKEQQSLLSIQYRAMETYNQCLLERIQLS